MMQTYKDSRDKSAQQKMQYSLLNKNWIRLNGLSMPFANVRKRFCYHERHYALSRRIFLDGDETKLKPMILKDIADMVVLTDHFTCNGKYVETPYVQN
jgi:RNA polymerase sigma-54 factor